MSVDYNDTMICIFICVLTDEEPRLLYATIGGFVALALAVLFVSAMFNRCKDRLQMNGRSGA